MTYIFDLDGTLADVKHRRHLVEGKNKNFDAFNAACVYDSPNTPVVDICQTIRWDYHVENPGEEVEVLIFSGRSEAVRDDTEYWLDLHAIEYDCLYMRGVGDVRPDVVLKREMLVNHFGSVREALLSVHAIFDDRDCVVAMWRELGFTCLQVAPGDF